MRWSVLRSWLSRVVAGGRLACVRAVVVLLVSEELRIGNSDLGSCVFGAVTMESRIQNVCTEVDTTISSPSTLGLVQQSILEEVRYVLQCSETSSLFVQTILQQIAAIFFFSSVLERKGSIASPVLKILHATIIYLSPSFKISKTALKTLASMESLP